MLEIIKKMKKIFKYINKFLNKFPNFHLYLLLFVYLHGAYIHLQINELNWVFAYFCAATLVSFSLIYMKFSEIKSENKRIKFELEYSRITLYGIQSEIAELKETKVKK